MMSDNIPIKPPHSSEVKSPTPQRESPPAKLRGEEDPWAEMFRPFGATPVDIEKFKSGVYQMLNTQIAHDRAKALEAIRRMREEL